MKLKLFLAAWLFSTVILPLTLSAQSTAFTYQGRLDDGALPANGHYDFRFAIYDAATDGNVAGNPLTNAATVVSNGVFTVQLDFGADVFDGGARWMEIGVATNGGGNAFATLLPRQSITSSPYAIKAANAGIAASASSVSAANIAGTIGTSQLPPTVVLNGASGISLSGTFAGNGGALTSLNPYSLSGFPSLLSLGAAVVTNLSEAPLGNGFGLAQGVTAVGKYVYLANGYNDGLRVFNVANPANPQPVAHLTYPELGTGSAMMLAVSGNYAYLANGYDGVRVLSITNPVNPVVVGQVQFSGVFAQAIAVSGANAFVANTSAGLNILDISNPNNPSVVGSLGSGAVGNVWSVGAAGGYAFAGSLTTLYVVNVANPAAPVIVGSLPESAMGNGTIRGLAVSGSYVYLANSGGGFVIVDVSNPAVPVVKARLSAAVIYSPYQVTLFGTLAFVSNLSGGVSIINVADPANPSVMVNVPQSAMNGGQAYAVDVAYPYAYVANNTNALSVLKLNMTLAGDGGQFTNLNSSSISGVVSLSHLPPSLITNNQSAVTFGGAFTGVLSGDGSGVTNLNASWLTTGVVAPSVLPGFQGPNYDTVGGGQNNSAGDQWTTIGGGQNNSANGTWGTVSGGHNNSASGYGAVGGGNANNASGGLATVPGGENNVAAGFLSFAAGNNAQANHQGSFVWADSVNSVFTSSANNQFNVRAGGGVRLVTGGAGMNIDGPVAVGSASTNTMIGTNSIGIGTNNPQAPLHIHTASGAPALRFSETLDSKYWYVYIDTFNGGDNLIFKNSANQYMGITWGNGAVFSSSDAHLKTDIAPLAPVLDRVLQLQPVSYRFTNNPAGSPKTLGLLAQEVELLFPEAVQHHEGMLGLSYTELVPVTVKAIQDLNAKLDDRDHASDDRIQRLEAENSALKQENEALDKRLEALEKMMRDQRSGR